MRKFRSFFFHAEICPTKRMLNWERKQQTKRKPCTHWDLLIHAKWMQKQFAFRDDSNSAILGILLMLARLLLLKKEITRTTFWVENYKNSVEHVSDDDGDEGKKTICKPNGSLITSTNSSLTVNLPIRKTFFASYKFWFEIFCRWRRHIYVPF